MTENVQIFIKLLRHIKIPDISLIISEYSISPKLYIDCNCIHQGISQDPTCIVCKNYVCNKCTYADPRICTICITNEDDVYHRQCTNCLIENVFCEMCKEMHCELHSTENICQLYVRSQQLNKDKHKRSCKIVYFNTTLERWTNNCKITEIKCDGCNYLRCPKHHNEKDCITTRKLWREIEKIEDKYKDDKHK